MLEAESPQWDRLLSRFIREEKDDEGSGREVGLARRYYSKLFREYCIADLSRYKVEAHHSSRSPFLDFMSCQHAKRLVGGALCCDSLLFADLCKFEWPSCCSIGGQGWHAVEDAKGGRFRQGPVCVRRKRL